MHSVLIALMAVLLLAACGGSAGKDAEPTVTPRVEATAPTATPAPTVVARAAGCGKSTATGPSLRTITSDGLQRTFRVFVPASYRADQPAAVLLNYHGLPANQARSGTPVSGTLRRASASSP